MPGTMFQPVVSASADSSRRRYTLPLSFVIHTGLVAVLVVVPLIATAVLPAPRIVLQYMPADLPPAPPPAAVPAQRRPAVAADVKTLAAPVEAPQGIAPETGLDIRPENVISAAPGVVEGFGLNAIGAEVPPPAPSAPVQPIRVGGELKAPTRIKDVPPVYPEIAKSARVQGVVILEAMIGIDGKVQNARVLRSVRLLDQAALNAVQSWEYSPTLLNGQPVPVIMTVTVQFKLE